MWLLLLSELTLTLVSSSDSLPFEFEDDLDDLEDGFKEEGGGGGGGEEERFDVFID